jgi:hypothetical protein
MAVLTAAQVVQMWSDTGARLFTLFRVEDLTSGDTVDLGALGFYRQVKQAMFMGATVNGTAAGTISVAVVTVPAGLSHDAAYMLVDGVPLT